MAAASRDHPGIPKKIGDAFTRDRRTVRFLNLLDEWPPIISPRIRRASSEFESSSVNLREFSCWSRNRSGMAKSSKMALFSIEWPKCWLRDRRERANCKYMPSTHRSFVDSTKSTGGLCARDEPTEGELTSPFSCPRNLQHTPGSPIPGEQRADGNCARVSRGQRLTAE